MRMQEETNMNESLHASAGVIVATRVTADLGDVTTKVYNSTMSKQD